MKVRGGRERGEGGREEREREGRVENIMNTSRYGYHDNNYSVLCSPCVNVLITQVQ